MPAPQKIHDLIARFERNREHYRAANYNETETRREFIDPFFKEMGWDVDNEQGYAEAYKEVVHETAVKVAGKTKAPDYAFRVGGQTKYFVEAKKPSVNIKEDIHPAYQLRSYAWSGKLPLSILTDFEEFAVYDCRPRPAKNDKAAHSRVMYFTYDQYVEYWDEIKAIFSPEAIRRGSFDKYVQDNKAKRGTAEVDDAFLADISGWRELLARNIALRNERMKPRELNFAVQRTIDRLIFLRIAEDRGIELYGRLRDTLKADGIYSELTRLFRLADQKYNSGLFHFKAEKGREEEDEWTLDLQIDDKPLRTIIKNLYYPDTPFQFDMIPADILGQVYEQFLGKVIRLTASGQAKIEDKPEVKKAGGVFYTPTYIVDYIVAQTVGKLLDGRKLSGKKSAAKLSILDPACGSGSFLIGAYQYLLNWYLTQYKLQPDKWAKMKAAPIFNSGGDWQLTIEERKRILLANIYGVDIDPQAVEVTKLSLLLKVLDGETAAVAVPKLLAERVLPDLSDNIKCGNSLIGPDFYDGQQFSLGLLDEEELYRINAFDWAAAFPDIVNWGGFDAVIGNPPYVDVKILGNDIKDALADRYDSATRRFDLYIPFVEKCLLLVQHTGLVSFIMPTMFMRRDYGIDLRKTILEHAGLECIVDFGTNQIFQRATNYVGVFTLKKGSARTDTDIIRFDDYGFSGGEIQDALTSASITGVKKFMMPMAHLTSSTDWYLRTPEEKYFIDRLFNGFSPFEKVLNYASEGIHSGKDAVFFVPRKTADKLHFENPPVYPLAKGKDIHRYDYIDISHFPNKVIYPYDLSLGVPLTEQQLKNMAPQTWKYLENSRDSLKGRAYFDKSSKTWYELWCQRNPNLYTMPKIIGPEIAKHGEFTLSKGLLFFNNKLKGITFKKNVPESIEYFLGLLNSKLLVYVHRAIAAPKASNYFEVKTHTLKRLPIRRIDFQNKDSVAQHDQLVSLVKHILEINKRLAAARLPQEKTILQRQLAATDNQIDQLVYQLYGLTPEEIAIVEGG